MERRQFTRFNPLHRVQAAIETEHDRLVGEIQDISAGGMSMFVRWRLMIAHRFSPGMPVVGEIYVNGKLLKMPGVLIRSERGIFAMRFNQPLARNLIERIVGCRIGEVQQVDGGNIRIIGPVNSRLRAGVLHIAATSQAKINLREATDIDEGGEKLCRQLLAQGCALDECSHSVRPTLKAKGVCAACPTCP